MFSLLRSAATLAAAAGCAGATAYHLLTLLSARRFLRERESGADADASFLPPVSILKPLKGMEPGMEEAFRSHGRQRYPEYEIIFGANDRDDPGLRAVEKLKQEFPERAIRAVVCERDLGANRKVSNLAQMASQARYEYLVVNDSDIQVEADYLRQVAAPLAREEVGLVTCLYRGLAGSTLGSRLEALGIGTDFAAGVLAARLVEGGLRFGLGSTLAFRRADLEAIGGFEGLADFLADDYELGRRLGELRGRVALSTAVVATTVPAYGMGGFLRHQLRWARTIRDARRGGYAGLTFTFALPWAILLACLQGQAMWAWGLAATTVAMRLASAWVVGGRVLGDAATLRRAWLIPLRDAMAVFIWLAGFAGNTIQWRGETFRLRRGRLVRVGETAGRGEAND